MRNAISWLWCVASVAAQVSPASLANADGSEASSYPFDLPICRFQQMHADQIGTPRTIHGIAFRRDANGSATTIPMWWSDLLVRMGEGHFETSGPDFAANYVAPPIVVRSQERFVLPDWSQPPAGSPQPFDMVLMFDTPFVYSGNHALIWEIEVVDNSGLGALGAVDAFEESVSVVNQGQAYGQGCNLSLTGNVLAHHTNRLLVWVGEHPYSNSVRFVAFGTSDPNLMIPGLCVALRTDPFTIVNAGIGANYGFYVNYDPMLVGQTLRAQMLTFPALQMSNAVELSIPALRNLGDRDIARFYDSVLLQQPNYRRGAGLVVEFL